MLHRLGRRRPPGGLCDTGPAGSRAARSPPSTACRPKTGTAGSDALVATGGSQCGFCTPGIVMRLAALAPGPSDPAPTPEQVRPVPPRPPVPLHRVADHRARPLTWYSAPCQAPPAPAGQRLRRRRAGRSGPRRRRARPASCLGPGRPRGWGAPGGRPLHRPGPGRIRRRHLPGRRPGRGARRRRRLRPGRVGPRGPGAGRQGPGPSEQPAAGPPDHRPTRSLGPDPAHHLGGAGLRRT